MPNHATIVINSLRGIAHSIPLFSVSNTYMHTSIYKYSKNATTHGLLCMVSETVCYYVCDRIIILVL